MPGLSPLQQLDSWPAVLAAGAPAVAAVLAPPQRLRQNAPELQAEAPKGEALKPKNAPEVAGSGTCDQLFDSIAIPDLASAVKGLPAAIAAGTASEKAYHANHLTEALTRVTQVLDRQDKRETGYGVALTDAV